jgi:signal transduction histidine kinase
MNTQGIGLGLVISDNIVEQFSGRIGCKSRYNHGSTFMFSILLGKDEDYIDKTKVNEVIKMGENLVERLNPPFVSNEEEMSL